MTYAILPTSLVFLVWFVLSLAIDLPETQIATIGFLSVIAYKIGEGVVRDE